MNFFRRMWGDLRRSLRYRRVLAAPAWTIVLRYHAVGPVELVSRYVDRGLSVTPDDFRTQVSWLQQHFELSRLDAALEALKRPRPQRPSVVLSFDDGYRDNHSFAWPILSEAGASAVFFITTDPVESCRGLWTSELVHLVPQLPQGTLTIPGLNEPLSVDDDRARLRRRLTRKLSALTRAERESAMDELATRAGRTRGQGLEDTFVTPEHLRQMAGSGMEIGAHTLSHPHLDLAPTSEHRREMEGSRHALEQMLGQRVMDLAYPNPGGRGTGGPRSRESARALGFRSASTSTAGTLAPETDVLRLPRIGVYSGRQQVTMFAALARLARTAPPALSSR